MTSPSNRLFNLKTLTVKNNTKGRDFFVGDIHGYLNLFWEGLNQLNFNPDRDRVFSVGDLVDKGPDNLACLRLINNDWFYATIGNHEIQLYENLIHPPEKYPLSINWQPKLSGEESLECQALIKKMYAAITVDVAGLQIGVVHAGVPENLSWTEFITQLENADETMLHFSVWDREVVNQTKTIEGIDWVVSGHQCLDSVSTFGNIICIDTGAFIPKHYGKKFGLTFAYLSNDEFQYLTINNPG